MENQGRLSAFTKKEVVNILDGRRLGFLCDADVNFDTGKLESIVISLSGKVLYNNSKISELTIPFDRIKKVGEDIILVNVEERFLKRFLQP